MVKQIFLIKRKSGISFEDFKKYYLENHVPLVKKTITGIRKYVINFALQRGKETAFDSIGEIWWDDVESIKEFNKTGAYEKIIAPDEEKFINREQIIWILTEETIQK
jgi:uncharacterized protein (TIGR02118 family)